MDRMARVSTASIHDVEPVTEESWEGAVLHSDTPVLVDFWAPWCGPCRLVGPILEDIAAEYDGRITVRKLNTDESPRIATEYDVQSIPTLMIFKQGHKVDAIVGAAPKPDIKRLVDKHVAGAK